MKIIVTTYPFDEATHGVDELRSMGYQVSFNSYKRKMSQVELHALLVEEKPDIIIAGTEKYNAEVLDLVPNLQMISRVGIGMDSVDSTECEKRSIVVTNTPDAPSNAVAELTIGQIINGLRKVETVSEGLKQKGSWDRFIGREIAQLKIGVIGYGRIGKLVIEKLKGFNPKEILVHDLIIEAGNTDFGRAVSKSTILEECDVITLHIPLTDKTENYISKDSFSIMKSNALLINTSRGGMINEDDLFDWLLKNKEAFGVVDVFCKEPYKGNLRELTNISLTPHMGSCSKISRFNMEGGSVDNVLKYLKK